KQMLLRLAREACPEPDLKRARLTRVLEEKTQFRLYQEWKRAQFQLSPEREAALVGQLARTARVRVFGVGGDKIDEVRAAIDAGQGFDALRESYALSDQVEEQTVSLDKVPREVIESVLLDDAIEGTVVGPIMTRRGALVLEVLSFEPLDLESDPHLLDVAKATAKDHDYLPIQQAFFDSVRAAARIVIHDEAIPLLHERFTAYWESLQTAPVVDYQTVRAPLWSFDDSERAQPLFDLSGRTYTIGDFVSGLNQVDLEFWPTLGSQERIRSQVEQRVLRLLLVHQVEAEGFPDRPECQQALARIREEQLLQEFHDRYLAERIEVPEDRLHRYFEENQASYVTGEQVSFGFLSFPETAEARVRELREQMKTAEDWTRIATAEAARGDEIEFVADTGLRSIRRPPDNPAWIPMRNLASNLTAGEISPVAQIPGHFVIVRVNERAPQRPSTFEEARTEVFRIVQQAMIDEEIDRRLGAARSELHAQVRKELLTDAAGSSD
ncbi:MAG: peptidyl-prolyl cis-trans isomerase, partial [Candidatus Eisenbacteria bacterium]|nr:peptidyl-prolyl cis-trans isomerase [Candidatus Eisenbacteria bacterium]